MEDVKQLGNPARRYAVDAGLNSSVEISFGGSASSTSSAWMAEAHIITGFGIRHVLAAFGISDDLFIPVKLGYLEDVNPGLFDPVTDS